MFCISQWNKLVAAACNSSSAASTSPITTTITVAGMCKIAAAMTYDVQVCLLLPVLLL